MTSPARRKGSSAEREAANQLSQLTGFHIRRRLQEGRADDVGDLEGLPDTCIQVRSYKDPQRAIREGLIALRRQQQRSGSTFAALLVRRPGGRFVVAMEIDQFATLVREATGP